MLRWTLIQEWLVLLVIGLKFHYICPLFRNGGKKTLTFVTVLHFSSLCFNASFWILFTASALNFLFLFTLFFFIVNFFLMIMYFLLIFCPSSFVKSISVRLQAPRKLCPVLFLFEFLSPFNPFWCDLTHFYFLSNKRQGIIYNKGINYYILLKNKLNLVKWMLLTIDQNLFWVIFLVISFLVLKTNIFYRWHLCWHPSQQWLVCCSCTCT